MLKSKRGQGIFGMSYGAIFSIFVIIFIVSVAFIAIKHFIGLNRCTQVGFFYDDLQKEVEKAWASGRHDSTYEGNIPTSGIFSGDITHICFGKLTSTGGPQDAQTLDMKNELIDEFGLISPEDDENVFIYPPKEACDGSLFAYSLKCRNGNSDCLVVGDDTFFCEPVNKKDGTVTVKLFYRSDISPYVKLTDAT